MYDQRKNQTGREFPKSLYGNSRKQMEIAATLYSGPTLRFSDLINLTHLMVSIKFNSKNIYCFEPIRANNKQDRSSNQRVLMIIIINFYQTLLVKLQQDNYIVQVSFSCHSSFYYNGDLGNHVPISWQIFITHNNILSKDRL